MNLLNLFIKELNFYNFLLIRIKLLQNTTIKNEAFQYYKYQSNL